MSILKSWITDAIFASHLFYNRDAFDLFFMFISAEKIEDNIWWNEGVNAPSSA